jgi:hypothetical protein
MADAVCHRCTQPADPHVVMRGILWCVPCWNGHVASLQAHPAGAGLVPAQDPDGIAPLAVVERAHVVRALELLHWNLAACADALRISRATMYRKLREHGLPRKPSSWRRRNGERKASPPVGGTIGPLAGVQPAGVVHTTLMDLPSTARLEAADLVQTPRGIMLRADDPQVNAVGEEVWRVTSLAQRPTTVLDARTRTGTAQP